MPAKEKAFREEDITVQDIKNIFHSYPDIATRLAHLMRTGKVGVLLAHHYYVKSRISDTVKKNENLDFFDILTYIFLKPIESDLKQYKTGEITIDNLENRIKESIKLWCKKNKLPELADLNNLKLQK